MPGSPQSFLSSVSHDDAASAVVAALRVGAGVYNVSDDEPLRRREFFDSLAAALGVKPPVIPPKWVGVPRGLSRGDVGALAPNLEPEAARGERLEAEVRERAGRLARGRRGVERDQASRVSSAAR